MQNCDQAIPYAHWVIAGHFSFHTDSNKNQVVQYFTEYIR